MLRKDLTLEKFGYIPDDLSLGSKKLIIYQCDFCNLLFERSYFLYVRLENQSVIKKDACMGCRHLKKNLDNFKEKINKTWEKKTKEELNIIKEKRAESIQEIHGCDPAELARRRNIKKYGVPFIPCTDEIKEKRKNTNIERFGTSNPNELPEIKQKIIDKNREKYGVDHFFQTEKVKEIVKNDKPANSPAAQSKRIETNLEKYGTENPQQNLEIQAKTKQTSIDRGHIKIYEGLTIKEWADKKDISASMVKYIVKYYGESALLKFEKSIGTDIEIFLREVLFEIGVEFEEFTKIENRKTDFQIKDLIIEANGCYWHSEMNRTKHYHEEKRKHYLANGYRSLFFYSDEIIVKSHIIKSIILNKLNMIQNKIYARKCKILELDTDAARSFIEQNHLMGYEHRLGKTYGLTFNNEIFCAMQVKRKDSGIEIARFCNKNNSTVVGGFSKLLSFIQTQYNDIDKIITFIDLRYGTGDYLTKLGFVKESENISFKWTNFKLTFHRMQFDDESAYKSGLCKIWDCGQAKWIKQLKIKNPEINPG